MQECLEKQGVTDEQTYYTKERAKYHTRAKNFLLVLKWKMYGLGEEKCSDIDGLSDITSDSGMSLSRCNDITRQIEAAVAKAGFRLSIPSLDLSVNLVHETLSQTQLPSTLHRLVYIKHFTAVC